MKEFILFTVEHLNIDTVSSPQYTSVSESILSLRFDTSTRRPPNVGSPSLRVDIAIAADRLPPRTVIIIILDNYADDSIDYNVGDDD